MVVVHYPKLFQFKKGKKTDLKLTVNMSATLFLGGAVVAPTAVTGTTVATCPGAAVPAGCTSR